MASGSDGVSAVVGAGLNQLGGGKEKGGRGSDGFGVGLGLGIGHGPGRRGGFEWSERVEWSGVELGRGVTH